jgi:hypothetical protein
MIQGEKDNNVSRRDGLPGNAATSRGKSRQQDFSLWESLLESARQASRAEDRAHRDSVNPNRVRGA